MAVIYVSIGTCIERQRNVRAAVAALRWQFGRVRCSAVYETEAFGFSGDPFYNLVTRFESRLTPLEIKQILRAIESRQGRQRAIPMPGPCPLDLDLLLYDDRVVNSEALRLPRPDILRHAYVLEPLAELEPGGVHPLALRAYAALWCDYQRLHPTAGGLRLAWDPLTRPRETGWGYPVYTQVGRVNPDAPM
ncbi:MAG: 2-amino-4-hydroxy-6-hydroxymethyldihydropteridine diphosphokinase [Thiotrichales bacterium]